MCELYYRELHLNSDGFTRQGGTRSHPVFDLDYPIEGVRYIGLKNFALPITWYNLPEDERVTIYTDLDPDPVRYITIPKGHYPTDADLAFTITNLLAEQFATDPDVNPEYNVPGYSNRVRWRWVINSTSPASLPFRLEMSPWLKRLLGYRSDFVFEAEIDGVHISQNLTRIIEPFEVYLRSSLMGGNMQFSNIVGGNKQAATNNVLHKIPLPASNYEHKTVYIEESKVAPSPEHMFPYSAYGHIKRFDMFLTTGPTRLFPDGREIDLNGYPFSVTLCLYTTVPL